MFRVGQVIAHATPRTITEGDTAVYQGLYGSRFAVQSSAPFARAVGYPTAPIDDLIVFHVILGKTVPDISLNAIANLGYADCRFLAPVYPGDTLTATSEVLGLRENSSGDSGIVYVRTNGMNQDGVTVLTYARWVMVRKRDKSAPAPTPTVPKLPEVVTADQLGAAVPSLHIPSWDKTLAGSAHFWDDYAVGEKIDHVDGMTIEEAEHQIATRLYQNTARVHFNQHVEGQGRFGRRLVYGGAVIVDETGYDNVMLELSGKGVSVRYRQRMPVPVSMWQPWLGLLRTPAGARADFFATPVVTVHGIKVATLICYEQLLVWPILHSAMGSPDMLVAPANGWWTANTDIVAIQTAATMAWARLFNLPLVMPINS